MNEEERFDSVLDDYLDYLREKRGRCPAEETLAAFQAETLASDEAACIREHVELCVDCRTTLRLFQSFEQRAGDEIEEISDWPEIEQRGRERFHAFLESQESLMSGNLPDCPRPESMKIEGTTSRQLVGHFQRRRKHAPETISGYLDKFKAMMLHPAFAYLLLLALLYPAYQGLFRKPDVIREPVKETVNVEVEKPRAAIDVASLKTIRLQYAERTGGGKQAVVRLSDREAGFFLSFLVPVSERPEFAYNFEIRNAEGRVVHEEKGAIHDALGNFRILCNREFFPPGRYVIQVKEINKTTQSVRDNFKFSFSVEQAPQR